MQKWLLSHPSGLLATVALTCAVVAGLFVGIAQVRCGLLEEDFARLKSRLKEEVESFKAEQETNDKNVLALVQETVKRVAAIQREEAKDTAETPAGEQTKEEPRGGIE